MDHSNRQLDSEWTDAIRNLGRYLFLGLKGGFRLINGVIVNWEFDPSHMTIGEDFSTWPRWPCMSPIGDPQCWDVPTLKRASPQSAMAVLELEQPRSSRV